MHVSSLFRAVKNAFHNRKLIQCWLNYLGHSGYFLDTTLWDPPPLSESVHTSFAFGQLRMYAGLWPNRILVCSLACRYDWPCGLIKILFLLSLAHILDGRAQLYSSELSYRSFCILLHNLS